MKKIIVAFLALTAFALASGPFPTYQSTPPNLSSAGAIAGTDQTYLCQGNCNTSSNLVKSTMAAQLAWTRAQGSDSIFSFKDSVTSFADSTRHATITASKSRGRVCFKIGSGITGTSNATSLVMGAFPTALWPTTTAIVALGGVITDSTVATRSGTVSISTSGVPTFSRQTAYGTAGLVGTSSATFLGSGTKAITAGAGGCYDAQ